MRPSRKLPGIPGQPSGTDAILDLLVEGRRIGLPIRDLCARAGVSDSFYFKRQKDGIAAIEAGDEENPASVFVRRLEKAEADRIGEHLLNIRAQAKGGLTMVETTEDVSPDGGVRTQTRTRQTAPAWQASAWVLERTRPEMFALNTRVQTEVSGKDGGPVQVQAMVVTFTPEEARLMAEAVVHARRLAQEKEIALMPKADPTKLLHSGKNGAR